MLEGEKEGEKGVRPRSAPHRWAGVQTTNAAPNASVPERRKTTAMSPQPTQTPHRGCGEPIKWLRNQYGTG